MAQKYIFCFELDIKALKAPHLRLKTPCYALSAVSLIFLLSYPFSNRLYLLTQLTTLSLFVCLTLCLLYLLAPLISLVFVVFPRLFTPDTHAHPHSCLFLPPTSRCYPSFLPLSYATKSLLPSLSFFAARKHFYPLFLPLSGARELLLPLVHAPFCHSKVFTALDLPFCPSKPFYPLFCLFLMPTNP